MPSPGRCTHADPGDARPLRLCFAEATAPEHGELVAEALAVILHLNEELMVKLRAAREAVLQQGIEQARTRSAIGQYQNVKQAPA